jgi:hypothetical protein
MTSAWAVALQKRAEIAPSLRRQFWLPLRRLLKMFHLLPLVAAVALFVLLAVDGQLKEIYVSYMEDVASAGLFAMLIRFAAAAVGFALISAVLYEVHYRLSGPRISFIFSMNSEVGTGSRLAVVQDASAIVIALSPWLGLIAGLLNADVSLHGLFDVLHKAEVDKLDPSALPLLVHVPMPSAWAIAGAVIVLGAVVAWVAALNPKHRLLQAVIMALSPPAAALVFLLLAGIPTLSATLFQIGAIIAALAATVVYWIVYYRIQMMRAYIFLATALQEDDNFSGTQWQRIILFGWALLPWLVALALYLLLPEIARENGQNGGGAAGVTTAFPGLAMIPVAMCWVIAIGLVVASSLFKIRDHAAARVCLYGIVCLLAGLGLLLFWLATPDQIVTVYRWVGPLGSLAFSLLFLISVFALLAILSQRSSFPALILCVLVIVASAVLPMSPGWSTVWIAGLCFIVGLIAILARLIPVAAVAVILIAIVTINYSKTREPDLDLNQKTNATGLTQQFSDWLTSRGIPGGSTAGTADSCFATPTLVTSHGPRYPIFIVAVEGGGIYAASAASTLLARLEDENPCFSDHVFAISAVSGGAIGAAIFQAIENARLTDAKGAPPLTLAQVANTAHAVPPSQDPTGECQPPPPMGQSAVTDVSFERDVCKIVEADNFSPLVASIFPELLGFNTKGRAVELAASFQHSANTVDPGAGAVLSAPFASDWSDTSKAPALALNATWVETGLRAAIAPFPLHKIDDSLYSFVDGCMPKASQSLIQAAVVSARFPFILPPYAVQITPPAGRTDCGQAASADRSRLHWNFVDGGYSDSSGAATALALYRALLSTAQKRQVHLELILLTSSDPQLEANKISGTTFADIMGPLDAILSVRAGLANEAVARACDGVAASPQIPTDGSAETQNTCDERANSAASPLQIVGVEDEAYGLSLGWKISQTTFSVVSWMLGQSDDVSDAECNAAAKPSNANAQSNGRVVLNEATVKRNSCVLRFIQQSLGTASASSAPAVSSPTAH